MDSTNRKEHPLANRMGSMDALRGFLALYVALHHFTDVLKDGFVHTRLSFLISLFAYGPQAVLGFFFLSGFVIMKTHQKDSFDWFSTMDYAFRRFRRLYGIYLAALLFTWLVTPPKWVSEQTLTLQLPVNLVCLQNWRSADLNMNVFYANGPLWSLPYEVVYYLVFPFFMRLGRKLGFGWSIGFLSLLILSGWISELSGHPYQATLILALGLAWWLGAMLATSGFQKYLGHLPEWLPWVSVSLIPLACQSSVKLGSFRDLIVIAAFFNIFVFLASPKAERPTPFSFTLEVMNICLWIILIIGYLLYDLFPFLYLVLPAVFLGMGLLLRKLIWSKLVGILVALSGISYAVYLIHYPSARYVLYLCSLIKPSPSLFLFLSVAGFAAMLLMAWVLEKPFQKAWSRVTTRCYQFFVN